MKLIIQIPCYNEETTLGITLSALPRRVTGFDLVEWLIIDDGSRDRTCEVAREHGIDHVITHTHNLGLARAFCSGIDACLELGADVIVNTDADNQYCAADIPALVQPIIEGRSEMVVGARPIEEIDEFSTTKKIMQRLGSWVIRFVSNTNIPDCTSGFRAYSRKAARQLLVINSYTYTLETIIQAGQKNISITSVPISVNKSLRPSKLVKNIFSYVAKSAGTIIRIFFVYQPFQSLSYLGLLFLTAGTLLGLRYVWLIYIGQGIGHVQSLILCAIFMGMGFQTLLAAFIADLMATNRKILEEVRFKLKNTGQEDLLEWSRRGDRHG